MRHPSRGDDCIRLNLAPDMRQKRTFAPRMVMYKYTEQVSIQ